MSKRQIQDLGDTDQDLSDVRNIGCLEGRWRQDTCSVEEHHFFSEAPSSRRSIPHPQTDSIAMKVQPDERYHGLDTKPRKAKNRNCSSGDIGLRSPEILKKNAKKVLVPLSYLNPFNPLLLQTVSHSISKWFGAKSFVMEMLPHT